VRCFECYAVVQLDLETSHAVVQVDFEASRQAALQGHRDTGGCTPMVAVKPCDCALPDAPAGGRYPAAAGSTVYWLVKIRSCSNAK
jgi:hypothetical protein